MVAINGSFLAQPLTGVQRFGIELSKKLKAIDKDIAIIAPKKALESPYASELEALIVDDWRSFGKKQLWEQIVLPSYLKKQGSPFLLNLGNSGPLFYGNQAVTLHDTAFLRHSEFFSVPFVLYYKVTIPVLLRNSKYIFTSSKFSKSEIEHFYGHGDKINVISNAISDAFDLKTRSQREKFILCVGSIEPRKNLAGLIAAFSKIKTSGYRLVVVGDRTKIYSDSKTADVMKGANNVEFTGRLGDKELSVYYAKASLFVYPSVYEGFGIPPLEAQKFGCPVIASLIPPHIEVLGDSALYCNPFDVDDMAEKIDSVLQDSVLVQKLVDSGYKNTDKYSWSMSAKKIYDLVCNIDEK